MARTMFPLMVLSLTMICLVILAPSASACWLPQTDGAADQQAVERLQGELKQQNEAMATLTEKINSGDGDLTKLQDEYSDTLDSVNETIDQLHDAALAAIENGGANPTNIRAVMGILLNEAEKGNDRKVLRSSDILIEAGTPRAYFEYAAKAPRLSLKAREIFEEVLRRQKEHAADDLPQVLLKTSKGDITVVLFENEAPETVGNFVSLVESGFYTDALFHRVIEGFMAQVGGPKRNDNGDEDPGYRIYDETDRPDKRRHFSDVLSMAKTSMKDSGSSQFFITFERTSHLDGVHTVFGRVTDGFDVVDRIARTVVDINGDMTKIPNANPDYIVSAEVIRKRDHQYRPRKVGEPEETQEEETDNKKSADAEPENEETVADDSSLPMEAPATEPQAPEPAATEQEADSSEPEVKSGDTSTNESATDATATDATSMESEEPVTEPTTDEPTLDASEPADPKPAELTVDSPTSETPTDEPATGEAPTEGAPTEGAPIEGAPTEAPPTEEAATDAADQPASSDESGEE